MLARMPPTHPSQIQMRPQEDILRRVEECHKIVEECLQGADQQTLDRVQSVLERRRRATSGGGTLCNLGQFRGTPWKGDRLLALCRRDRAETETAADFLTALREEEIQWISSAPFSAQKPARNAT